MLIYLNGGDVNGSDDSIEPLVGGETVFYGSRNSLVAEVHFPSNFFLCHVQFAYVYVSNTLTFDF